MISTVIYGANAYLTSFEVVMMVICHALIGNNLSQVFRTRITFNIFFFHIATKLAFILLPLCNIPMPLRIPCCTSLLWSPDHAYRSLHSGIEHVQQLTFHLTNLITPPLCRISSALLFNSSVASLRPCTRILRPFHPLHLPHIS